jgi:hypothetical protein
MNYLANKVEWTEEMRQLEALDWRHDSGSFEAICAFILQRIKGKLVADKIDLWEHLSEQEVHDILWRLADRFRPKHVSLLMFMYFGLQREIDDRCRRKGITLRWGR